VIGHRHAHETGGGGLGVDEIPERVVDAKALATAFEIDDHADIVVAGDPSGNGGGVVHVLLGDGAGGFAPVTFYSLSVSNPNSVAIGDLNGDGKVDLAVGDAGGNVVLLNGNGDGTFQSATKFATGSGTNSIV